MSSRGGEASAHTHEAPESGRRFAIGVALNLVFVAVEVVWGVGAHSLALLADAGHNLSDVLGLVLSWAAFALGRRPPGGRRTYGLRRTSILAALFNGLLLLAAVGAIAWEAATRFRNPEPVSGRTVMIVAGVGILINAATALLFMAGRKNDLNVRSAFLHMAADAAVSLGVVIAGGLIMLTGRAWIDPVVSLVVAAVILVGTCSLLRDSVDLAVDAVPTGIDLAAVKMFLGSLPGVTAVHDLHVWGMSTTEVALTAHVVMSEASADDQFYAEATRQLHDRFGIEHSTIQVERGTLPCAQAPDSVV